MFHMAFVQIGEFDCLPVRQKGQILEKKCLKISETDKVDKADNFHASL